MLKKKNINLPKIARFCHVSQKQFESDGGKGQANAVRLPQRMTSGSAGHDFFLPAPLMLEVNESAVVATGTRCKIAEGWVLMIMPKSGLGFKFGLRLANTVGVIDSDYFGAANEGHILIKLTNAGKARIELSAGAAFAQGIFLPFGTVEDDDTDDIRHGGIGSTTA